MLERLERTLAELTDNEGLRKLAVCHHRGKYIRVDGSEEWLVNFSSNDYLGIASNSEFKSTEALGSGSSRLLAGNFEAHNNFEKTLEKIYNRPALGFSSGYLMNSGVLPALTSKESLVIADKQVHASLIDSLRLCQCPTLRFRHNDLEHLEQLIIKNLDTASEIFVVVESLYSMDGDLCDLRKLVALKKKYRKLVLYVDEAHAVGVFGENGRGLAEVYGVENEVDIHCFTCGKALGSSGAFVICDELVKQYLVNKCRTLIFNTSLPPIALEWSTEVIKRIGGMNTSRTKLLQMAEYLRSKVAEKGYTMPSESHIIPIITGDNASAVALAKRLQEAGAFVLPIRTPTVAKGSERVRLSLTSMIEMTDIEKIVNAI